MSAATPPVAPIDVYAMKKIGSYGELGSGTNVRAQYIMTTFTPRELDQISLISDIPGSEKWEVRDLFQREIDSSRVEKSIIPYFEDQRNVKFFNPLTLTILPMDKKTQMTMKELPYLNKVDDKDSSGTTYSSFEHSSFYKLLVHPVESGYSRLEWDHRNVKLVAIDGQHRLSALKRIAGNPESPIQESFSNWSIPVVIIVLSKAEKKKATSDLLEVIRNIFIYINTRARPLIPARQYLLDNESVTAICTQELLQRAHENDIAEDRKGKESERIPLAFFDWKGMEKWNPRTKGYERVYSPVYVKTIEEIHDWFSHYIIGFDGTKAGPEKQEIALGLRDLDPPIKLYEDQKLSHDTAEQIRKQFHKTVMPGLNHLLENFTPYKNYIKAFRVIEKEYLSGHSDTRRYAWQELLYGNSGEPKSIAREVKHESEQLDVKLGKVFHGDSKMGALLSHDIGMRGIIYAFGSLKKTYDNMLDKTSEWLDYAKWFTLALNDLFEAGWLNDETGSKKKLFLHITEDPREKRIHYRLDLAWKAWGLLASVLILKYAKKVNKSTLRAFWSEKAEDLAETLGRGYKNELKPAALKKYPANEKRRNEFLKSKSEELVEEHIIRLEKASGLQR